MKELAVIILNWNGRKLLEQFLPVASRYSITEDADLIVADNGSTDDSVEWVKAHHPEVKVLSFSENYGFAEGYNKAIAQTQYKYTILLNSDVEVTEGWTRPLLDFMRRNGDVGALQPKIRSWKERTKFEYAGAAGGYLDKMGYPYCRGRLFDSIEEDRGQYDGKVVDICWASGAALMVRTDIYQKVGGLDARFFAHMEEIDLCCRIHAAGYRVVVVPDAMVFHVGGASLSQGNPKKTYLNFRNNLLLLHKNMPVKQGRVKLFVRRLYDTLAWGMFLLKFDFKNANAVLKAHNDFRKMKKLYTEHPDINVLASLPGAKRNIIIDYYLKRMKK
ncbi:MAG: glycosyltransferase family 2 protein [Muribaculaceae bacterium]|jgi:GT2 family glycosyltransferase|nr:glycosyltransferase family 2 protein [Muribaculaceae bacterium]MBO7165361.1 glycosyltransferase family 2 protein [Muribaculaceae bacterium]MBQ1185222.1 glycosyltransferase family 2 protein [Muribaculaceae bacterium]MBQ2399382.1 glycosyltransferase family 2 protein [Muribaculaceae bacterium]MBQ5723456.1 glycosyltransferase family 2 protein [Muribaculaceae bacterium]